MRWVNKVDVYDALIVIGFVAVEYGVSRLSVPAAWVVGGALLLAVAVGSYPRGVKH